MVTSTNMIDEESQASASISFDESSEESIPLLVNQYRLWIHVANLPRQGLLRGQFPSTCAVVSTSADVDVTASNKKAGSIVKALGQTEVVRHSCSPQYTEAFYLDYKYGSKHFFFVHVFSVSNDDSSKTPLGTARFEVGDILSARHHWRARRLRIGGVVFSRLEPAADRVQRGLGGPGGDSEPTKYLRLRLAAKDIEVSNRRSFLLSGTRFHLQPDLMISISRMSDIASQFAWITVFRSQPVVNSLHPRFDPCAINLDSLCHGNVHQKIRIAVMAVHPRRSPVTIGTCETTVRFLIEAAQFRHDQDMSSAIQQNESSTNISAEGSEFLLQDDSTRHKLVGRLTVLEADIVTLDESGNFAEVFGWEVREESSSRPVDLAKVPLIDSAREQSMDRRSGESVKSMTTSQYNFEELLMTNRCQFDFCVAIDFTSSNGDPINDESSLHYQSESINDYEETIYTVGRAIEGYSVDQKCSVWGFGSKFGDGIVRHLFQCGPKPEVYGVDDIIQSYKSMFSSGFTMSGPTVFLNVIQAAAVKAKRHHENPNQKENINYTILLIITDGIMNDFDETYRKLQAYKDIPLSIIFVGVGRSDFSALQRLCLLCPFNTTFVEFRSQDSPGEFALGALANLPRQVSSYAHRVI